jgi:hypothetical protein
MTPKETRKYATEKKTSTAEGKKEYQKFYMREYRSYRDAKCSLQDRWDKTMDDDYHDLVKTLNVDLDPTGDGDFGGDLQKLGEENLKLLLGLKAERALQYARYEARKRTAKIDNLDEVNRIYKEIRRQFQNFLATLKEVR